MTRANHAPLPTFASALKAIVALWEDGYAKLDHLSDSEGFRACLEIRELHFGQKTAAFFRYFIPLRKQMVALLAESYRRYFRLALAHARQTGGDPDQWARSQLQPAVSAALQWIRDWYILACDGENQRVWHLGSFEFVPGRTASLPIPTRIPPFLPPASWRAPAWLFVVSESLVGVGPLKDQHVPRMDSLERLGEAHTRLLLKGARRVFLWELRAAIETARNEEIAAAGSIPLKVGDRQTDEPNKRNSKRPLKGLDGLVRKSADLSRYMDNLTEKQHLAFSLRFEYGLVLAEVASRMGVDRKTAYEHIEAAKRKVNHSRSKEKSKADHHKRKDE
jgi:predicted DNA-binding protein YlxM (UPF0122 family)